MTPKIVDYGPTNERNRDEFIRLVNQTLESASEGVAGRVAIDCEGVNLSRLGTLEILSVCLEIQPDDVFLVDFQDPRKSRNNNNNSSQVEEEDVSQDDTHRQEYMSAAKRLLESDDCLKIIHDCRMDCDALVHLHEIRMRNVHDTSAYHHIISSDTRVSLNEVLRYNSLPANEVRDKQVYKTNPAFWAKRPMTYQMTLWASQDVSGLLVLATRQLEGLSATDLERSRQDSIDNTRFVVDKHVEIVRCKILIGRFIGKGGSNVSSLERRSRSVIYKNHAVSAQRDEFMVFYENDTGLKKVREAMGYY